MKEIPIESTDSTERVTALTPLLDRDEAFRAWTAEHEPALVDGMSFPRMTAEWAHSRMELDAVDAAAERILGFLAENTRATLLADVTVSGIVHTVIETPDGLYTLSWCDPGEEPDHEGVRTYDDGSVLAKRDPTLVLVLTPFHVERVPEDDA